MQLQLLSPNIKDIQELCHIPRAGPGGLQAGASPRQGVKNLHGNSFKSQWKSQTRTFKVRLKSLGKLCQCCPTQFYDKSCFRMDFIPNFITWAEAFQVTWPQFNPPLQRASCQEKHPINGMLAVSPGVVPGRCWQLVQLLGAGVVVLEFCTPAHLFCNFLGIWRNWDGGGLEILFWGIFGWSLKEYTPTFWLREIF